MANAKRNGDAYRYAVVDTALAPGGGGYFTDEVAPRSEHIGRMYFSIRETSPDSTASVVTVKLQFKCPGDSGWTEKKNGTSDWAIGDRVIINDFAAGVVWRAGVVDDSDYTSGSVTFGFDWLAMASEAFAGVGTKFQRWDGAAWQDIAEVNSIDGPGMTKDVLEVTSLDTDAGYNEFITGFAEGGTLTLDMNFTRETYELMKEDFESDEVRSYRIQLPDYDSEPSTFTIEGLVIELPITMTADDKVTADVVIQITSQVVLEEDSWSSYWTQLLTEAGETLVTETDEIINTEQNITE